MKLINKYKSIILFIKYHCTVHKVHKLSIPRNVSRTPPVFSQWLMVQVPGVHQSLDLVLIITSVKSKSKRWTLKTDVELRF